MRVAEICDTCATYINAACIIYNGDFLSSIGGDPLDSLDIILGKINDAFPAIQQSGLPGSLIPAFEGQLYINSANQNLYIGLSDSIPNWGFLGTISTTTTTTSTSTSSTTTTTTTAP